MKDKALRLALEKLTAASNYIDTLGGVSKGYRMDIERLKAALEAKDEPVAWAFFFEDGEASNELFDTREQGEKWLLSDDCLWAGSLKPLYTTPPQSIPQDVPQIPQEDSSNESAYQRGYLDGMAKRPQPLTDKQIWDIVDVQRAKVAFDTTRVGYRVARAIEAAHGIKGEAK